jgi:hypothetical protein
MRVSFAGICRQFVSHPDTRDHVLLDVKPFHCGIRPPTDAGDTEQNDPIDWAFCSDVAWLGHILGSTNDQWCVR